MKKQLLHVLLWAGFIAFTACSNQVTDKSAGNSMGTGSSVQAVQTSGTDSEAVKKTELTQIYTQAIAEYIRAVYKTDKIVFDTLFFGKHVYGQPDDFPDITLPDKIENTHIRLVAPELGAKLQKERKSLVYINMMGWVDTEKASFILVTFSNGSEHKFDYYFDYQYNPAKKEFELEKSRVEYFSKLNK